jgi:hypothetical protein
MPAPSNTLYYGDNLDILREHVADATADLIYLDPPFKMTPSSMPGARPTASSRLGFGLIKEIVCTGSTRLPCWCLPY